MILLLQHPVIKNCHLLPYNYALLLLKKGTPHFLPYQNQQMGSSRTLVHKKPCMKLSRVPVSRKVNLVLHRKFRDDPVGYDLAIPGNDRVPSYTPEFEECTVETSPSTLAILKNFKGTIMMICLAASSVSWFPTSSFPSICWWIHTFLFWRNLRKKSPSITPVIFLKPYVKLCHQWRWCIMNWYLIMMILMMQSFYLWIAGRLLWFWIGILSPLHQVPPLQAMRNALFGRPVIFIPIIGHLANQTCTCSTSCATKIEHKKHFTVDPTEKCKNHPKLFWLENTCCKATSTK